MAKNIKRVSQDDLADMITQAVDLEAQRVEQIGVAQVDAVSGGVVREVPDIGITMGLIAREDPFF